MNSFIQANQVDPNTFNAQAAGVAVPGGVPADQVTGAVLVLDRVKDASVDSIAAMQPEPTVDSFLTVTSTSTTYVASTAFDCAGFSAISVHPKQTSAPAGAVTVTYKLEWSLDNVNWFGDPIETVAAAGGGERIATVDIETHTWDGNVSAAYKQTAAYGRRAVQGRWVRVSQKSSAAVTVTTDYHFQVL